MSHGAAFACKNTGVLASAAPKHHEHSFPHHRRRASPLDAAANLAPTRRTVAAHCHLRVSRPGNFRATSHRGNYFCRDSGWVGAMRTQAGGIKLVSESEP